MTSSISAVSTSAVSSTDLEKDITNILAKNSNMFVDMTAQLASVMNDASKQTETLRNQLDILRAAQAAISDPNDNDQKIQLFFTFSDNVSFDVKATAWDGKGKIIDIDWTSSVPVATYDLSVSGNQIVISGSNRSSGYSKGNLSNGAGVHTWILAEKISPAQAYKYYQTAITQLEGELQSLGTASQQQQVKLSQFNGKYNDAVSLQNSWNKARHDTWMGLAGNIGR